jgi:cell cycle checkpoint protein
LVLFHALGKILYNKRVGDPDDEEDSEPEEEEETKGKRKKTLHLPSHWQSMDRRESRVDVEVSYGWCSCVWMAI